MTRGTIAGVLAVVVGILIPTTTVSVASAAISTEGTFGIRLGEVTAALGQDPRAKQYIVDHLNPGTTMHRRVQVLNNTGSPMRIELYPGAANLGDSAFHFAEGRTPNELTTWTSLDTPVVDVAAHSRQTATVVIDVPRDASPGEHYGVLWAQAASPDPEGSGIRTVNRVGIRMYLDIGPGGPAAADFTIAALTAKRLLDGRLTISTEIRNTGGRALDMSGELTLTNGPGGLRAGPFPANLGTTAAPGEVSPVSFALDGQIPAGPWTATVKLHSGLVERTATAVIRFPDRRGASDRVKVDGPSTRRIAVTSAAATGGALLGLGLLLSLARRWRRRRAAGS
ncbi:hypothetical protein CC117_22475 [Parafrankia colletiae]|uniref:DUF916 domain-containing protein n=1 Tax=Parafrankia colletiae TaxID=573497 RepID=A0A1S1QJ40_9ACTN|nr:hypothetical protein [Parafrankia colletiae]MCK9901526.1 hypothetical protein [Frankia sp. Cpl3]OHV33441.1 hypothetical protein CC117_22475 [Parafrankia colletiae]